jgi:acetyl/propionyl-CoA carboxylase alpha subunit
MNTHKTNNLNFEKYLPEGLLTEIRRKYAGGLLVANRGEIAVRIITAAQRIGISTVSVYASDDSDSLHVALADRAVLLQGNTLQETYLNQRQITRIAVDLGVAAVHPGYGFLAENADFAQMICDAGLVFIGPSPDHIRLMGEKSGALTYVRSLGVPTLKSYEGSISELLHYLPEIEFPIMVKASGGGGGKGMLICSSPEELLPALQAAERQALAYFGNGELIVEKYLPNARHIEVQLMGDHQGNVLHFYERECSVQRRFQKLIEEAPSPSVDENLREQLTSTATGIAHSMNYRNAGTIEFLLDENGKFYFLEMNTRIQVEHPVTELVTKTDLVCLQLLVAAGFPLPMNQKVIRLSGHAIEIRVCAEAPEDNFRPSAGKISHWNLPQGDNFRTDTFVREGYVVSSQYDSLLAKLIVWDSTRSGAIKQLGQMISQTSISGLHHNLSFIQHLIESNSFRANKIHTRYVDEKMAQLNLEIQNKKNNINPHIIAIAYLLHHFTINKKSENNPWNQIGFWRMRLVTEVSVDGTQLEVQLIQLSDVFLFKIGGETYHVKLDGQTANKLQLNIGQQTEAFYFRNEKDQTEITYNGFQFIVKSNLMIDQAVVIRKKNDVERSFQNLIRADLFGKVLNISVEAGSEVTKGDLLITLEAMKTEIRVLCPEHARVVKLHVAVGESVAEKQVLLELKPIHEQNSTSDYRQVIESAS